MDVNHSEPRIAVVGTLDTKGLEHAYLAERIPENGGTPLLVDVGVLDRPQVPLHYSREAVLAEAGTQPWPRRCPCSSQSWWRKGRLAA